MENFGILVAIVVIVLILFATLIAILSRYRKCPSDKILVVYGKVGTDEFGNPRSAKCIHGGAAFIVPVIQSYQYLDLTPISMNVDLRNALSKQNIRINVPSRFTVGISTEPGVMQNAAERLLGLKLVEIQELAKDIKKKGEDAKVAVRNVRRDANDAVKKQNKAGELSDDELAGEEEDIQKATDKFIAEIDKLVDAKTKEILTV